MTGFVIAPPVTPSVAVAGSVARFPIRRVFCVGRNYAAHAREMGTDLHHEVELVVAIGGRGCDVKREDALGLVWGYGVGVDLTRRDLQDTAKRMSRPWDWAKAHLLGSAGA